jgi:hypothetical protein
VAAHEVVVISFMPVSLPAARAVGRGQKGGHSGGQKGGQQRGLGAHNNPVEVRGVIDLITELEAVEALVEPDSNGE